MIGSKTRPDPVLRSGFFRFQWKSRIKQHEILILFLCLSGIVFNGVVAVANSSVWNSDFNEFYAAGKLAGTGHLYDWDRIQRVELENHSTPVIFVRMPVFAAGFKPLSALPFAPARWLWFGLSVAALAAFILIWPFQHRAWVCAAVCWSAPTVLCLAIGQDTMFFLLFAAFGVWLLRKDSDFLAGLVLSLCAGKPHLALLVPVVLAAKLKWKALLGGLTGGILLVLLSFAVEGPQWLGQLRSLVLQPGFDPALNRMPNLRGLLSLVSAGQSIELALALIVAAAVYFLCRPLSLTTGMALALAGGLLLSHHAFLYDALLLIPALFLPFERKLPKFTRYWAMVLCTPLPYLLLLTNLELPGQILLNGYTPALVCMMIYGLRRRFREDVWTLTAE